MTGGTDPQRALPLAPEPQRALRRALGAMPYAPLAGYGPMTRLDTVDDLVGVLDALAAVLRRTGERAEAEQREHARLRSDVAAVRRVLGVAVEVNP